MKASFFTESVLYWLARGASSIAQRLPASWNVAAGAAAGAILYHFLPGRRVAALDNLRAAFGPAYTPEEYRRILKEIFRNFGRTFAEVARIPRVDRFYVDRWIRVAPGSRERMEAALARGKGIIFLTGHFGCWELISIAGALRGYPTIVLAREQGWPRLNRLLTQYRESKGCKVVAKGFPVRELIQGLREGKGVGILADQDGGKRGVLTEFFGRLASTAPGTVALSLSTGAPILPVFMIRTRGAEHLLSVGEPLAIPEEGTIEERVRSGVAAYMRCLEQAVRKNPSQWLWMHRRWKSCPERRILIFSDGKAGHMNQCRALADRLEAAWVRRVSGDVRLQGIGRPLVSVQTVEVSYRHRLGRLILAAVASLAPRRFSKGDRWLKWALAPSCYRAIASAHADFSISCGASTAPVNLLWAGGLRARTVHITRPRMPSWRRFDLVVIPRHDSPPSSSNNVLVVDGALSPRRGSSQTQTQAWKLRLGLSKGRQIGLLLGGPTRGLRLDPGDVQEVVVGLILAAEKADAELLVTSSRRTPPEIERQLEEMLKQHPRCRLLTLVNRPQAGGLIEASEAVPLILELASGLVVSGDSISMVSEAADQAKPVVAFLPRGDGLFSRKAKYRRFLRQMDVRRRVRLVEPAEVGETIEAILVNSGDTNLFVSPEKDPVVEFLKRWL